MNFNEIDIRDISGLECNLKSISKKVRKEEVFIAYVSMKNHTTLELTSSTGFCSVPCLYRNIICLVKWGIEIFIGLDAEKREH